MSLSKIGKTSALTGALSDLLNNKGTLKNVNDSLLSFGNIDIAAAALAKASVGTGLSDANLTAMLQSAYGGTESAANAAGLAMSNALSSVEVAAPEASAAVSGISGAFATTKAAAVGFLSVMKSILPIAAIIGGAFVAGKLAWDNILTNNTVDKNYKNSSDKYDNAKSELTSLQTQYDTNKERIQELNAKQYLSSEERAEKNKLERENQLLDSQVSTGKNVVSASQKQKALDAQKTLDKSSYHKNYAGKQKNKVTDSQKLIYQDDLDQASDMIKQLDSLKSQRDEIINNRSKQSDSYFSAYQKEERKLKWLNEDISQLESDLSDNMSDISKNSESFWDDKGNLVDTTTKKTADRAASIIDYYNKVTGASDTTTDKLNNIFALDKFKDVENRLTSIGASGKKEDILNKISEIDGLQEALDKAGISAETLADNIMSVANPDKKNINGIKENLKDEFSYKDGLYNFFKDKSDKELENFWDYYTSQNLNAKKYDWNLDTVKSNFDQAQVAAEKTNPISTPFSSLFKNSAEDTATDLDTITDNFQTDMSNIKSSMDSIKSGTFQNSDITDLIQQFPELATETDNLQQGLQNLAFDKASDAIGKIRDSVKDVTDPKQLAAADKYIQSIMDTMDLSGFDMSNAKSAILGNLTKNLADKHMASVTTPNLVNQLMSEYGNDEIAVQAIMKLSLDPSMANADLDTWKSKIEDTKVQIQLDTSAKNLDNLSKELTRLQTDASDQQTRLNNKSAYNMKATASDYTNLIENGDKQIENLNKQIQEYQTSIDTLRKSKGLSPLSDEDNEQIKQYQDQIQAANMSIENMKAWAMKTMFSICSNGVLYRDEKVQAFLRKWANRLSFSVTIDGNKELHDSCRVFPDGGPSYDIAVDAASDWMKRGNHMGSKITIAPGNISFLYDAIKHMVDLGYDEINANCVYEKGWTPVHATVLYDQMKRISDYFLEQNFDFERDFFCSLYNEDFFQPKDPDDLQSWCGGVGNSMIACDPQGRIFPCIRYMESSLNGEQEPYSIGDVDNGIGCTECYKCRINCMAKIDRRTQSTDECFYCPIAAGCSNCSGYDYQVNGTPDSKATYICVMHKARALGNLYFWNKYYRKNNMSKRMKNYVPDEWALEIISESELNMLKELERED